MTTDHSGPLSLRPRLLAAIAFGIATGWLLPVAMRGVTRLLLGWNATVWLYLGLVSVMMLRADHGRLKRHAAAHAEGAVAVLIIAVAAAAVSLAAIVAELGAAKAGNAQPAGPPMLLALATLVGSWLLLPVEFALAYASRYYVGGPRPGGLAFPGPDDGGNGAASAPHYADFLYFSFTIAATAQTSDVAVTTRAMRRLVIAHGVVSFAFNTMVLALAINMAASQF